MIQKPDPEAERIKAKKERKKAKQNARLAGARARGLSARAELALDAVLNRDAEAGARIVLEIRGERLGRQIDDDGECHRCQKLQAAVA